jgi:uncharacterized repeat protein (TIGR01451 family)
MFGLWPNGQTHPPMGVLAATTSSISSSHRVVMVRDPNATHYPESEWNTWYGQHVDQARVNNMFDEGLKRLTDATNTNDAWKKLIPNYQAGQKIAVKVNFNYNDHIFDPNNNFMDALVEPVNALIKSLKTSNVREEDIIIFDASRLLPDRFSCRLWNLYPNIQLYDREEGSRCSPAKTIKAITFNSTDPSANVTFSNSNVLAHKLPDQLVQASYYIDLPIMKRHSEMCSLTGSLKNNLGILSGRHYDDIHAAGICTSNSTNPLVDIWNNPNIKNKTVLILADALYGGLTYCTNPGALTTQWCGPGGFWNSFNNQYPNSMLLAVDPVAIDSVMNEYVTKEAAIKGLSTEQTQTVFLEAAANAGLGVHEHCPLTQNCSAIDYQRIDLGLPPSPEPHLIITKEVSSTQAAQGEILIYTISYQNTGNGEATNATIEDVVDLGKLTNIQVQDSGSYDNTSGKVTWDIGSIAAGASGTKHFTARVR